MIWHPKQLIRASAAAAVSVLGSTAFADSISPEEFTANIALGGSETIRKTVVINEGRPTSSPLDVMFVFDVTGSMGGEIAQAKAAASDILAGLAGFGSLKTGSGWYSDFEDISGPTPPGFDGVHVDLNAGNTGELSGIDDMWDTADCTVAGSYVGCGGDFSELGYAGIADAALNASWTPGSSRFIIALGDASFKTPPTEAETIAALDDQDVSLIGVSYDASFASDIVGLEGTAYATTDTADIVQLILDAIEVEFDKYSEVTVSDILGEAAAEGFSVTTSCVTADIGVCVDDTAEGSYDRSVDRTFTFDVTFTREAAGDSAFDTHALVDGSIAATEADRFPDAGVIPLPATAWMLLAGIGGLGAMRRRKKS